MNALIALLLSALACIPATGQQPLISNTNYAIRTITGIAMYYAPGVFDRVVAVRVRQGYYPSTSVVGWASVPDCRQLGHLIWASINGHRYEPYQVMDCSAPRDRARHVSMGLVIEVDYASARRNGFTRQGRAPARVLYP